MKATREDFENFLEETKRVITANISCTQFLDFKDYSEFVEELKTFLNKNSDEEWEIITKFGIGIKRI